MRITNKIMQNNSLYNINNNKLLQDKLSTQMATEQKINRPSDDPVIAIRALRLRSNLTEITQYYEKNVPDAKSWLEITEKALTTTSQVIEDMYANCNKAANGNLETSNRKIILDSLQALRDEVYATGDADYAGRTVFTGYRTNEKLTFLSDTTQQYTITEQLGRGSIDKITYVKTANSAANNLENINSTNYDTTVTMTEQDVKEMDVYRFRLAYDKLDGGNIKIQTGAHKDADGNLVFTDTYEPTVQMNSYDIPSPYEAVNATPSPGIVVVKDTGEILMSKDFYDRFMSAKDNPDTLDVDEGEIRISYDKSSWDKGDLNPIHYFACTGTTDGNTVKYNENYLTDKKNKQNIEYDIGFNQSIRVNTTADQAYTHAIGRDVDEMVRAMQDVLDMESVVATLKAVTEEFPNDKKAAERLEAANKALELLKDKEQLLMEKGMTKMQGHLNKLTQAITDCGTLGARLDMAEKRLESQQTTFDTLASENEKVDVTQVTIEMASAEFSYNAALMATGKVVQNTLLDFL